MWIERTPLAYAPSTLALPSMPATIEPGSTPEPRSPIASRNAAGIEERSTDGGVTSSSQNRNVNLPAFTRPAESKTTS